MTQLAIDRMFAAIAPAPFPARVDLDRIKFGAQRYLPTRDFLRLFPHIEALPGRNDRIAILRLAKNAERERGRRGDRGLLPYSESRLIAICAALLAERVARARDNRMAKEAV